MKILAYRKFCRIDSPGHICSSAFYITVHQLVCRTGDKSTSSLSLSRDWEAHEPQDGRGYFSRWSLPAHCVELAALKGFVMAVHS